MRKINEELQQIKEFEDMGCPLTEVEIKETINRINDRKSKLSEYKFELILTECQASDIKNILFKSFVNSHYEFGALHSALSLDGTIIEWGRGPCGDSLVCPTMDINRFLFAFEVRAREDKGFFESLASMIKGAITAVLDFFSGGAFGRWSVGRANDKKLDKSDFVSEGEFRHIIKTLEHDGTVDFYFRGKSFNSRKDLDDYVKSIRFNSLCKDDKKLLMCYKNTFDIYHKSDPYNEKFK